MEDVVQQEDNALMVDEEEEEDDGEDLIALEEQDEEDEIDADDQDDGLFEDEDDYDLPSPSEDLGMLFAGIGNRHRGGIPAAGQRDILFNMPDSRPEVDRMRIERADRGSYGYEIRLGDRGRAEG
jgi:hypothetical protein